MPPLIPTSATTNSMPPRSAGRVTSAAKISKNSCAGKAVWHENERAEPPPSGLGATDCQLQKWRATRRIGEPRAHMSSPLQTLLDALDATPLGDDRFEARSIETLRPRVFGGELLAQVLATAARTVQDRACHAIHVDFLSPGDPKIPIEYGMRRVRDGRRFVQRQVSGYQRGREIVLATMSFTTDSTDAVAFQHKRMPEVPGPDRKSVA